VTASFSFSEESAEELQTTTTTTQQKKKTPKKSEVSKPDNNTNKVNSTRRPQRSQRSQVNKKPKLDSPSSSSSEEESSNSDNSNSNEDDSEDEEQQGNLPSVTPPTLSSLTIARVNDLYSFDPARRSVPLEFRHVTCHFCDTSFDSAEERFHHNETMHLTSVVSDSVESSVTLYSRVCGKSSTTPFDLSLHDLTIHGEQLQFSCNQCQPHKKFYALELLQAHEAIHLPGALKFPCSLCPKSSPVTFDTSLNLENHLSRVHTHSLTFSSLLRERSKGQECEEGEVKSSGQDVNGFRTCRFCGRLIMRSRKLSGVRTHERSKHPEKFIHRCSFPACGETFAEVNELKTCMEIHRKGPGPWKCFVCNLR